MEAVAVGSDKSLCGRQAVYRCLGADGKPLYIGTTGQFGRRIGEHAQKIWFLEVRQITLEWFPDEGAALEAERVAIEAEQPKYNVAHKASQVVPIKRNPRLRYRTPAKRLEVLAATLDRAGAEGTSARRLMEKSGMRQSSVYELLAAMVKSGTVIHVKQGTYKTAPGRSAVAAVRSGRLSMPATPRTP